MSIETHPATSERFEDLATMVGPKKPTASVCWCLSHRVDSKTNRALVGPERGEYVRELTKQEIAPGVLAYREGEVVGWVAVAPKEGLPVSRSRKYPKVDDLPVWSIWCVRVRPGYRGQGIAHELVRGAVAYARELGAPVVESYPADNGDRKMDLTMAFVGTKRLFEAAGFHQVAETDAVAGGFPRVLMRLDLR